MYLHTNGFGGYPKNLERLLASTTGSSQASNVSQIPWVETIQLSSLGETRSLFLKCSALDDTKCDKVLGCGALTRWFWAAPGSPPRGFFEVRTFPLEEEIGWWQMKEVVKKPLWHLPWLGMCLFIVSRRTWHTINALSCDIIRIWLNFLNWPINRNRTKQVIFWRRLMIGIIVEKLQIKGNNES